jgi:hypothetical protein
MTPSHTRSTRGQRPGFLPGRRCLPQAGGRVTITPGSLNDTMKVSIHGIPANAGFDLFVIQQPLAPFGVSWYQTDVNPGSSGSGSATVRGIFDVETFSVSPGGTWIEIYLGAMNVRPSG